MTYKKCNTCCFLGITELTNEERPYCTKIANCDLGEDVTAYDDEGGQYAILIINNPDKFGCALHSESSYKLKSYPINENEEVIDYE